MNTLTPTLDADVIIVGLQIHTVDTLTLHENQMARVDPSGVAEKATSLDPMPTIKRCAADNEVPLSASEGTRVQRLSGTVAFDMTDTAIANKAIILACVPAYIVNLVLSQTVLTIPLARAEGLRTWHR